MLWKRCRIFVCALFIGSIFECNAGILINNSSFVIYVGTSLQNMRSIKKDNMGNVPDEGFFFVRVNFFPEIRTFFEVSIEKMNGTIVDFSVEEKGSVVSVILSDGDNRFEFSEVCMDALEDKAFVE